MLYLIFKMCSIVNIFEVSMFLGKLNLQLKMNIRNMARINRILIMIMIKIEIWIISRLYLIFKCSNFEHLTTLDKSPKYSKIFHKWLNSSQHFHRSFHNKVAYNSCFNNLEDLIVSNSENLHFINCQNVELHYFWEEVFVSR